MTIRQLLCFALGGHDWMGPRMVDGRLRLVCAANCGAMTRGVQTRGQERLEQKRTVRPFLTVKREERARRSA